VILSVEKRKKRAVVVSFAAEKEAAAKDLLFC